MNGFIYARQSVSDETDDSLSIQIQIDQCKAFAAAKGISVVGIFKEQGISGRLYPSGYETLAAIDSTYTRWVTETKKKGQWRRQLGSLLKRLDEIQCIICYDITRLHRSLQGSFLENLLIQELTAHGVKVVTIKEGEIDYTKFTDKLVTSLTAQISSDQLSTEREKCKAALARQRATGEWCTACSKSFGYRPTGRKREVEVNDYEAAIVRQIYKRFISGVKYWSIIREVNAEHYKKTGKVVTKGHCIRILKNPVYAGYMLNDDGELVKAKPIEGKEIIDLATWKKAQEIFSQRKEAPKRDKKHWLPISGKVFCGYCGSGMHVTLTKGGYVRYACLAHQIHGLGREASCRVGLLWEAEHGFNRGDALCEAVKGLLPVYYMDKLRHSSSSSDRMLQELEVVMHNLKAKQTSLTKLFMDGLLNESSLKDALKQIDSKMKETALKMEELKTTLTSESYTWDNLLIDLNMIQDENANEEIDEALRWVVKKVTIYRDNLEVETPMGSVELPIEKRGKAKLLPKHTVAVGKNKSVSVIYYYEDLKEDDWRLIGELGGVKLYFAQ